MGFKIKPPKISAPKISLPKVELPKVEIPKVDLPKVELPDIELPGTKGGSGGIVPSEPGKPKPEDKPLQKITDPVKKELQRTLDKLGSQLDVEEAGEAIVRFIKREAESSNRAISDSERRLREGKVIDAFWHMHADKLSDSDDNLAKVAQESTLVQAGMRFAATYYGGPAGAAAFDAWLTYKSTGRVDLAIRAAIISGIKAAALAQVDNAFPTEEDTLVMKSIICGAIGGVAAAAAGGDGEDVGKGFLSGGGSVLVFDGYEVATGHSVGDEISGAFVMTADDKQGQGPRQESGGGEPPPNFNDAMGAEIPSGAESQIVVQVPNAPWQVGADLLALRDRESGPAIVLIYTGPTPLFKSD